MRILTTRRLLAVAISLATLVFTATPAAAVPYTFDVIDGTIQFTASNWPFPDFFDIDYGDVDTCPQSTISVDFAGSASSGDVTVTSFDLHAVRTIEGGDYYVHIIDTTDLGDDMTGTYSSVGTSDEDVDVGLIADIYESDVETCEVGELVCTLYFDMDLYGTYGGTAPSSVTWLTVSGETGDVPFTSLVCDAPFYKYIDGTVEITDPLVLW